MAAVKGRFEYVCAHDMRPENPLDIRLNQMWQAVREETGGVLDVKTGQVALRRTCSATDPSMRCSKPLAPCVPMTMTPEGNAAAAVRI